MAARSDANDYSRFDSIVDPDTVSISDDAKEKKDKGNAFFKAKNYPGALKRYSRALDLLKTIAVKEETAEDKALRTTVLSNRAMCYSKMGKFADAKKDCEAALKLYPAHTKAAFRLAQAHDSLGNSSDAYRTVYRLLKRDPSNKAARALGVKLQGQIHARSRQTIAAEVEASLVKEKKDAEKAEMEAKKKAAAAAAGTTTPAKKSATPAKRASTPASASASGAESSDDEGTDEEGDLGGVRGYKTLADGRTTSYFHRELDATAKALLAKSPEAQTGPRRVHAAAGAPAPPVPRAVSAGASDWNRAGTTWEDKNVWPWAQKRIEALLVGVSATCSGGVATVLKLESTKGSATVSLIRGTKRFIFDLSFAAHFDFVASSAASSAAATPAAGILTYRDLGHDDFDDGEFLYVLDAADAKGKVKGKGKGKGKGKAPLAPSKVAAALNAALFAAFATFIGEFHAL